MSTSASSVSMCPHEWFFIFPSAMQMMLHLIAMSPGCSSTPIDAASRGPRPSYTSFWSYPRMAEFATSEPGWKPCCTVFSIPVRPLRASMSIYGVLAACSRVLPPSSSLCQSAMPSPNIIMCFITCASCVCCVCVVSVCCACCQMLAMDMMFANTPAAVTDAPAPYPCMSMGYSL